MPAPPYAGTPVVDDKTPPSAPTNLNFTYGPASQQVKVIVTPSADNVGVNGYAAFLNGSPVEWARSNTPSIDLFGVPPGRHVVYIKSFDVSGNYSAAISAEINIYSQSEEDLYENKETSWHILNQLIDPQNLSKVRSKFKAAYSGTASKYLIVGDSTRETPYSGLTGAKQSIQQIIAARLFAKITSNISVDADVLSGQSATDWLANVGAVTQTTTIAKITGTGSTTVLEFSFGINDMGTKALSEAQTKTVVLSCIDAILAAKPDTAILLVTPVKTGNSSRNVSLQNIYIEIAYERSLPLIDGYAVFAKVYESNFDVFYLDATHPNHLGAIRLYHHIVSSIVPYSLRNLVTWDNPVSGLVNPELEAGLWDTTTGIASATATWRRLKAIAIPAGATHVYVRHAGNRNDCMTFNGAAVIQNNIQTLNIVNNTRVYMLKSSVTEIRINISNDGANYDLLNDIPKVWFESLSIKQITAGLKRQIGPVS